MKRIFGLVGALLLLFGLCGVPAQAELPRVLSRLDFHIVGLGLQASPEYQAVPKGIATQVLTGFSAGDLDVAAVIAQLPGDYTVRAELSGPAFPTPRTLVTRPGSPFDIPTLALLGKHTLSNIRLVDGSGTTLFGAVPQAVIIETISDPLITEVKTKPLSLAELQERGVTFDASNFTAYEFTAAIATSSGQVPLTLPVLIPNQTQEYKEPTQIPPSLAGLSTPPEIDTPPQLPNVAVEGFMLEAVPTGGGENLTIGGGGGLPAIPGVLVIPGNIGFLHQYFSALAIVTNGAPGQSNLSIRDVQARLILPVGADLTPGSDATPGDDPLRMAKGADGFFPRTLPVLNVGADGKVGTADDRAALSPTESGQADFTIEGLKEGTHKLDFEITAVLDGLPVGPVQLKGKASGAVLVRNPDFTVTLGHPETIRSGEAYDLFVTITNTGASVANLVSVRLDPRALSGAVLAGDETPDKTIETILPGSAGTIKYRVVSQRTGKVTATAFASEDVKGNFTLRMGVGELGIPLSPDSLILPYTGSVRPDLVTAVVGLLGQAWSVATAPSGALPADVLPISRTTITARANALSEAGLRQLFGEAERLAAGDLMYDLFGSDRANRAFDDLRRRSTQGREIDRALGAIFGAAVAELGVFDFQHVLTQRSAYRGGQISAIADTEAVRVQLSNAAGARSGGLLAGEAWRELPYADAIPLADGGTGTLLLASKPDTGVYRFEARAETAATFSCGLVAPGSDGVLRQYRFSGIDLPAGGRVFALLTPGSGEAVRLQIDADSDGTAERSLDADETLAIPDPPPAVTVAVQLAPGFGPGGDKHGRNIALLFDERVTKASAEAIANYAVEDNGVVQVRLQPSGRMAFVLLNAGVGPFYDHALTVADVRDEQGEGMLPTTLPIRTTAQGSAASVTGTVRLADGSPVAGGVVRLIQLKSGANGENIPVIVGETIASAAGAYRFEYVLQNDDPPGPFTVQTTHPDSGETAAITAAVAYHGQAITIDLFMKARGSVTGTVLDEHGAAVGGASVLLQTLNDSRSYLKTTDASGRFVFAGVSVGPFSLKAVSQTLYAEGTAMGMVGDDGAETAQDVTIYRGADVTRGNISGMVSGPSGTPLSGALVKVETYRPCGGQACRVFADWTYADVSGRYAFSGVYTGSVRVEARDSVSGETGQVSGQLLVNENQVYNVVLKGRGRIVGRVVREDALPVTGLYVMASSAGVSRYVLPTASGDFVLDDVPVGGNVGLTLFAGPSAPLTSASVALLSNGETVYVELFVPLVAVARGSIEGTVYRLDGTPAANVEVRRLVDSSRYYATRSDAAGHYRFTDLPLGSYALVAMAGEEVSNASTELRLNGQVKQVALIPFGRGKISGTVYDEGSGMMPVGADIQLFAMRLDQVGWLTYDPYTPIATVKSDPQSGHYQFAGVYVGNFAVKAANLLRPNPATATGRVNTNNETVTVDLILKDTFGSLSGQVLLPDGMPASAGVRVWLQLSGAEVVVTTDSNGHYAFRPIIPAGSYLVTAEDPATTLTVQRSVRVEAGRDVALPLQLLGRGTLSVRTLNVDGSAAAGVDVTVRGAGFPNDSAQGESAANGYVTFENLSQGTYAVDAVGYPNRGGRGQGTITADHGTGSVQITLSSYGTVMGRFVKADGTTPVPGGQITLMQGGRVLAYALSSSDPATAGRFTIEYVPLGDFTLEGRDPISERIGKGGGRLAVHGATVAADVVVVPRGTVKGVVLNYAGSAPVADATVTIRSSGALNFNYTTSTAPDGTFTFTGVPAGTCTVDTVDPATRLTGTASGALNSEGQIVELQVHLAPSGRIEGHVFLPDGVTPASAATVNLGGVVRVVDPASGFFSYPDLASGRSYTLTARESGSNRVGSVIATVSGDGQTVLADMVLRGIGTVGGKVFDTDAVTPLVGARVVLSAAEGVSYTGYSDLAGTYAFGNVPAGRFSLSASHPQRLTAASTSGVLSSEGEEVAVDLTFGEVGSLTGTVLLPDATTPARGGLVRLTSVRGGYTAVIDSEGRYLFHNIPLCSFSLAFEDASGTAINKLTGTLTVNGETKELGTTILDDKPITVVAVDPVDGTANVPLTTAIKIMFSEPANPSTLNGSNIKLLRGTSVVAGTLVPDGDNAGITLVPTQPLAGFTLYTVVVTTGVRDRVERALPQTWSASFTTIDNIPPAVQSVSPPAGAIEVPTEATVRVTFSETIDSSTLAGIRLLQGGTPVATRIDLVQGGTVAILTPTPPLSANAVYSIQIAGVTDTVGNVMAGPYTGAFVTIDTIAPEVTSLSVVPGALLIQGQTATLTATVDAADTARVDFYCDDQLVGSDTSAPYSFALTLARSGVLHLKAIAQDRVGNRGASRLFDLEVSTDRPPSAAITAPALGSAYNTGTALTVNVTGSDDVGVREIVLTGSGAFAFTQTSPPLSGTSVSASFTVTVPVEVDTTRALILTAIARDTANQSGEGVQRTVAIHDSIVPTVTSLESPGLSVEYRPGDAGVATIVAGDNIGITSIVCSASGAATGNETVTVEPPQQTLTHNFAFVIDAAAAPHAPVSIVCRVGDAAGLHADRQLALSVADVVPPRVVSTAPKNGATGVDVRTSIKIVFDEEVTPASVTLGTIRLLDADYLPVVGMVSFDSVLGAATFVPASPLLAGATYVLLADGVADRYDNRMPARIVCTLTTDGEAPVIVASSPVDGAEGVQIGATLMLQFDEPVSAASPRSFLVASPFGVLDGTVDLSDDRRTLYFKPFGLFAYGSGYTATLSAGVEDLSGNRTQHDYSFSFTTEGPNADLVGIWHFDGDTADASGHDRDALPLGAPQAVDDGIKAQTYTLDGVDDAFDFGSWFDLQNFTIEFWLRPAASQGSSATVLMSGTAGQSSWSLHQDGAKTNLYQWAVADGSAPLTVALPAENWSHVVVTRDRATRMNTLYLNGAMVAKSQGKGDIAYTVEQLLYAGRSVTVDASWHGSFDEMTILATATRAEDVRERFVGMTSTDILPPPAPVAAALPAAVDTKTVLLTGSKEANSSIRVNDREVVAHDTSTTWQAFYTLAPGENLLAIDSHDAAGNVGKGDTHYLRLLPATTIDASLFAYWPLDGNWFDYSGNNHNLTPAFEDQFSSDRAEGMASASLNGDSSASDRTAGAAWQPVTEFTVSGWIKPMSAMSGVIVALGSEWSTSWAIWFDGDAKLTYRQNEKRTAEDESVSSDCGSVAVNRWTHFAVVVREHTATVYLDGIVRGIRAFGNDPLKDINDWLAIGGGPGMKGNFNGLVDDIAIRMRALTVSEVAHQAAEPPAVTLVADGSTAEYRPGSVVQAHFTAAHAEEGLGTVICSSDGAATGRVYDNLDGLAQGAGTFSFTVVPSARPNAPMTIDCSVMTADRVIGSAILPLQVADFVPPSVVETTIRDNSTSLVGNEPIAISFDEELDPATVTTLTVRLLDTAGNPVDGKVTLSSDGKTISFVPAAVLSSGGTYRLVVGTGVTDRVGNPLGTTVELHFATLVANDLTISNAGTAANPYVLSSGRYGRVAITASYVSISGAVIADTVTLASSSRLTHPPVMMMPTVKLGVTAGSLTIDGTSKIDVTGKGYLGANQPVNFSPVGRTLWSAPFGGSTGYCGGSYGGNGGVYSGSANTVYGSLFDPNEHGSGGASSNGTLAGNGGGLVRITAGTLTLDGAIVADGGGAPYGGGSGGGIRLDVGTLNGSGAISAKGGTVTNSYGAGGGGRIAIYYDTLTLATANIVASGGNSNSATPSYRGGAGTIYLKPRGQTYGIVLVDNNNVTTDRTTPVPCGIGDSVIVQQGAVIMRSGGCQ